jgi:hypothetical protein
MPTEHQPVSVAQVVHRAVEICDPSGGDDALAELLARYEDRDEPVSALTDVAGDLSEAARSIDVDADGNPPLAMAVAVATYLAHKRAELDAPREDLLRRAAKAEFPDGPPPAVVAWLEQEGVAA